MKGHRQRHTALVVTFYRLTPSLDFLPYAYKVTMMKMRNYKKSRFIILFFVI